MIFHRRLGTVFSLAILLGILHFLFLLYLPEEGDVELLLSTVILNIGGGMMNTGLDGLLRYCLQLTPAFLLSAILGVAFYQHFSIAGVYIFSREPKRVCWYLKEMLQLLALSVIYHLVFVLTNLVCAHWRSDVTMDAAGVWLGVYHIILNSLWLFSMVAAINLVSLYLGSDYAFLITFGIQIIQIGLLLWYDDKTANPIARYLPISHLILYWHRSDQESLNVLLSPIYQLFSFPFSVLVLGGIAIGITGVGCFVIRKLEFIKSGGAA